MNTITKSIELNGCTIKATVIYGIQNKTAYADGENVKIGEEAVKIITVTFTTPEGKSFVANVGDYDFTNDDDYFSGDAPKGAYARIATQYLSKKTWDAIMALVEELEIEVNSAMPVIAEKEAAPKLVRNPAYAHLNDKELAQKERDYDNLQNEGYRDSFNPYRDLLYVAA